MKKVHLLFKKEDIDETKIEGKVVVVFDLLLATSVITAALHTGAKEVIPVSTMKEAMAEAAGREKNSCLLVGEHRGKKMDHFHEPNPMKIIDIIDKKTMILLTTNGTVAINQTSSAEQVYIASLLNERAVAQAIVQRGKEETIILVCSGSSGEFCIEDFYGAGSFIASLMKESSDRLIFTEAAFAAHEFYKNREPKPVLTESRVGQMLTDSGYGKEISFVSQRDSMSVVPQLSDSNRICLNNQEQVSENKGGSEIVERSNKTAR
ncbi:2-phosphosulfolactate phosphatase [Alkalicoccus saliphilus]|uniref:Probable 2-phosphosulfolactate phosphatase n=1 Tax=Alkalicoccus saliphilus TaxID=200989 RepID=A0A2T4U768_9BACI|nr:2-phosphosulfolactate phosphatase [Alkalicoccus saliphilus]PTL39253.1 2-phosphosulfolactate phosphatase [Alkalicoccus saliphilus]